MEKEESLSKRKDEQEEIIDLAGTGRSVNEDGGSSKRYSIKVRYHGNPESQLKYSSDDVKALVKREISFSKESRGVSQRMKIEFEREVKHGFVTMTEYFDSGFEIVENESKIHQAFVETGKRIILAIRSFLEEGSWVTSKIIEYTLSTAPIIQPDLQITLEPDDKPATTFIELPQEISHSWGNSMKVLTD